MKINSPLTWWRKHLTGSLLKFLASAWIWALAASVLWVPVEYLLGYLFGADNPILAPLPSIPLPVLVFALTLIAALAHNIRQTDKRLLLPEKQPSRTVTA